MKDTSIHDIRTMAFGAISGAAILAIVIQLFFLLKKGEVLCLNQGCKVVEGLVNVSPVIFNLLGLGFFTAIFGLWIFRSKKSCADLLDLVLLSGAVAEGILINYQRVVAGTFCSYCILIALLIFLLLVLRNFRLFSLGLSFLFVQALFFNVLRFDPLPSELKDLDLDKGTYAVRSCSSPEKQVYLIFSEDCPHCKRVIEALRGCSRCEFHFNPVSKINNEILPDITKMPSYNPLVNRLTLKLLGIESIPVIIAKDANGLTFIKGDKQIIQYVQEVCFSYNPLLEEHWSDFGSGDDGVCSFENEKECEDLQ